MTSFEQREEGFERRFVVDEELGFRTRARRNKLLGLWVAQLIGKNGAAAEAHANAIVAAQVERADDQGLFDLLRADLDGAGVEFSDHRLRRKMEEAQTQARAEIAAGV